VEEWGEELGGLVAPELLDVVGVAWFGRGVGEPVCLA
jgi:hypothetical protein